MRYITIFLLIASTACTPAPDVHTSQEALWARFGDQPVDALLLAWGAPMSETRLTDGSRLISYQHTTIYEGDGAQWSCKVSFLARPPQYLIDNIALEGSAGECYLLSQGHTGNSVIGAAPPPYVGYPVPYRRYPF